MKEKFKELTTEIEIEFSSSRSTNDLTERQLVGETNFPSEANHFIAIEIESPRRGEKV